ncbi:unnamed protein product, partial [Mesorhabditis spiculigera]
MKSERQARQHAQHQRLPASALVGFGVGLSLIVAIGAQNAFVLRQGIGGIGTLLEHAPSLITFVRIAGAVFLLSYAIFAAKRALRPQTLAPDQHGNGSRLAAVTMALALTWLNPHVYLDTVVLMGSIANGRGEIGRWWFCGRCHHRECGLVQRPRLRRTSADAAFCETQRLADSRRSDRRDDGGSRNQPACRIVTRLHNLDPTLRVSGWITVQGRADHDDREDDGGTEPRDSNRGLSLLCLLAAVAGVGVRICRRRIPLVSDQGRRTPSDDRELGASRSVRRVARAGRPGALCTVLAVLIVRRVPLAKEAASSTLEAVSRGEAKPPESISCLPDSSAASWRSAPVWFSAARAPPYTWVRRSGQKRDGGPPCRTGRRHAANIHGRSRTRRRVQRADRRGTVRLRGGDALISAAHRAANTFGVSVAVGCARLVIGDQPDFEVGTVPTPQLALLPLFVVFGILTGLLGIAYNRLILGLLDAVARLDRIPPTVIGATIGATIGLTLFLDPLASGGGDVLAQMIVGGRTFVLPILLLYLAVRFFTGPALVCRWNSRRTVRSLTRTRRTLGSIFTGLSSFVPGVDAGLTVTMATIGMAAFFGAVVRAPFTGIVIVVEMTAVTSTLVPMLAATAAAVFVATAAGSAPIYDSLRERMLETRHPPSAMITIDIVPDQCVGRGAFMTPQSLHRDRCVG